MEGWQGESEPVTTGAADTQVVSDYVRYFLHQHVCAPDAALPTSLRSKLHISILQRSPSLSCGFGGEAVPQIEKGAPADVKTAANLTMQLAYNNKSMLMAGMILAGWDKHEGGSVYGLPIGGTLLRVPFTTGGPLTPAGCDSVSFVRSHIDKQQSSRSGSGSSYIYGFCDQAWKEGMTREEAEAFVIKAVSLAMARDGSSGGVVRLITVNEEGAFRRFVPGDKLPLYHEELEPIASLLVANSDGVPTNA
eukprot:SM000057S18396  [mRNA]  locus=s57:347039:349141:- [translate_table: standard]